MPMPATLPSELLGATLQHVDTPDLCAAARASHALQREAERHLYRDVSLKQAGRGAEFLEALKRCPERALYVRSLAVFDYDLSCGDFSDILQMLGNLEILDVHTCAEGIEARDRGYPFKLRELVVHADCDALAPPEFVRCLLGPGPQLVALKMPLAGNAMRAGFLVDCALSDALFLPNLQTLHAPYDVLLAFLQFQNPGRKRETLKHLGVPTTKNLKADSEIWNAIETSGCDIRSIEGVCTGDGYAVLEAMAKACPRVESVELVLLFVEPFGFDLIDHDLRGRPPLLNHLRSLSLMTTVGGNIRPVNARTRWNLRQGLLLCCPKLELLNGYPLSLPRTFDM